MPTSVTTTPPNKYALGRNSTLTLGFYNSVTDAYDISVTICMSQGSVSIDTDTIEVPSNCQGGWKIKLPGLIGGTVTGSGYIASSIASSTEAGALNMLKYMAGFCSVAVESVTQPGAASEDSPFVLTGTVANPVNGFFKTTNVSISPDDSVKIDFTIELSGAQSMTGYMAVASATY
jgi:hypothetical protein